ncbi:MAG TPA: site-specific integrase, partial [Kofleriaceae bacterium]
IDGFASAQLDRGMKVKTVNNRLAVLSTLIKYRMGERSKLRFKLDGMAGELHALPMEDVERLLAVTKDDRYRAVLLLACEAGLRAGEIRGLQWTDVKDGILTVRRGLDKCSNEVIAPKHNKTRTVPLSPRLVAVLEDLPRRGVWTIAETDGRFVVYDDLSATVNELYKLANVERPAKPIHSLRHTFGTQMAKRVPLPVLQKLMGHSDIKTTLRYIDVGESDKRNAIADVFGDARGSVVAATWQRGPSKLSEVS